MTGDPRPTPQGAHSEPAAGVRQGNWTCTPWPKIVGVSKVGKDWALSLSCGHTFTTALLEQYDKDPSYLLGKGHNCRHGCVEER